MTFNSIGSILYVVDSHANEIVGISMADHSVVERYAIGAVEYATLPAGDELTLAPDGSFFLVATQEGVLRVDTATQWLPVEGYGILQGAAGDDTLYGALGNDTA